MDFPNNLSGGALIKWLRNTFASGVDEYSSGVPMDQSMMPFLRKFRKK